MLLARSVDPEKILRDMSFSFDSVEIMKPAERGTKQQFTDSCAVDILSG